MCFCVFWFSDCSNAACPKEGLVEEKSRRLQICGDMVVDDRERERANLLSVNQPTRGDDGAETSVVRQEEELIGPASQFVVLQLCRR